MPEVTFRKGARLERWERKLEKPIGALKQIGALAVAESRKAFREQRFGNLEWEPRAEINVYGIIADFAQGGKPKKRRFEQRPALKDTGALSRSVAFALHGAKVVRIGTNLPYAGVHQYGGRVESETITAEMQKAIWKWLKSKSGGEHKSSLGFLLNKKFTGKRLEGEVPARQFVGITGQMRKDIRELIGLEIFVRRHT